MLLEWMKRSGDPALPAFEGRGDPAALAAYMDKVDGEAGMRNQAKMELKSVFK